MFPSWKIAKILGIDLLVHWTFWLLPAWVIFTWDGSDMLSLGTTFLLIGALFACVVLHEFGHALTARRFGIETRRVILTPLGGLAQLDRMSQKPWEEFCIAIAGPLVNVAIVLILGIGLLAGYAMLAGVSGTAVWHFLSVLLGLNVAMIVFNLLPAFPMDGGRVLRAILANSLGLLQGTRVAVAVGTVVAAFIAVGGMLLLGNPFLLLIGLFVIWAGFQELRALEAAARDEAERREWLRELFRHSGEEPDHG